MTVKKHHVEYGGFQGDVVLFRIEPEELPKNLSAIPPVANEHGGFRHVITHSETGHHHVMDMPRPEVVGFFIDEADPEPIRDLKRHFVVIKETTELKHLRDHHTHETLVYSPGTYIALRQQSFDTKGDYAVAMD